MNLRRWWRSLESDKEWRLEIKCLKVFLNVYWGFTHKRRLWGSDFYMAATDTKTARTNF